MNRLIEVSPATRELIWIAISDSQPVSITREQLFHLLEHIVVGELREHYKLLEQDHAAMAKRLGELERQIAGRGWWPWTKN